MHKNNVGTHYADFFKAWLDWDQDGIFQSDEVIGFFEEKLEDNEPAENIRSWETPTVPDFEYFSNDYPLSSTPYTLTNADLGDHWLLARVTCSESLLSTVSSVHLWSEQWNRTYDQYMSYFNPTGYLYQGEAELYKLTVNPVPEPATMFLFGAGLVGLAGIARRKKK